MATISPIVVTKENFLREIMYRVGFKTKAVRHYFDNHKKYLDMLEYASSNHVQLTYQDMCDLVTATKEFKRTLRKERNKKYMR